MSATLAGLRLVLRAFGVQETEELLEALLREADGQIPRLDALHQEQADARAVELLAQVGATVAAFRLGCSRSSVYRAASRHYSRRRLKQAS